MRAKLFQRRGIAGNMPDLARQAHATGGSREPRPAATRLTRTTRPANAA
jgi:hypothetical protein